MSHRQPHNLNLIKDIQLYFKKHTALLKLLIIERLLIEQRRNSECARIKRLIYFSFRVRQQFRIVESAPSIPDYSILHRSY